ncbi:hypothetical protein GGI17_002536 [Coemansia sp. S146]|nr:hypothetical protein GGI17_002536 [Coemansia sp. S146]
MNVKQDNEYLSLYSSDDGLDDIDEPVTKASLDVIMCEVSTIGSTWADLRKQYSPKQPAFEPLSFNTITWAAFAKAGTTGLDNDIVVDEAYSQAATMVAYGVELLRVALSGPEIHRSRIIKVGNMLTTLCASLSDTRDQHRVVLSKMLVDKVNAYRRSQGMSVDIESEAINSLAKIRSPDSGSTPRESVGGTDITSATDSTAAVAVVPQISRQVELPAEFGLQSVVRDGLLSQGLLESAITEYLHDGIEG